MHCLTDRISSLHWFVLLAVGMAGDETINPVKLLTKPNRATSQKKKKLICCACMHSLILWGQQNTFLCPAEYVISSFSQDYLKWKCYGWNVGVLANISATIKYLNILEHDWNIQVSMKALLSMTCGYMTKYSVQVVAGINSVWQYSGFTSLWFVHTIFDYQ